MNEFPPDITAKAQQIRLVIFDIDGVLTSGALYLGDDGQEYKAFHSLDGHGIRMLQECGLHAAVITGRKSQVVLHRMQDLGVEIIYQGYRDKRPAFAALLQETKLKPEQIAYMGDDVVDLPVMTQVGLAVAVDNAHTFVKQQADWITSKAGGTGAAREFIELLLQTQGLLQDKLNSYLS